MDFCPIVNPNNDLHLDDLVEKNLSFQNSRERSSTPLSFTKSRGRLTSESSRTSPPIQEKDDEDSGHKEHQSGFHSVFGSNCEESSVKNGEKGQVMLPFKSIFPTKNEIEIKYFTNAAMDILIIYGNVVFLALKFKFHHMFYCFRFFRQIKFCSHQD